MYNWTSWLDDYGFGKCPDVQKCNVFPDGKPFPQSNDWRHKSYVYVWHTMGGDAVNCRFSPLNAATSHLRLSPVLIPGQYYETCDGSSSSVTINTTNIPLGAQVMEVMVYRKRERRKYSPLTTDTMLFYVTGRDTLDPFQPQNQENSELTPLSHLLSDLIHLAVSISQEAAVNQSDDVFFSGKDVVFKVQIHDPSGYLKTAAVVDYIWDFGDSNRLVTHRDVTAHTYSRLGTTSVKMVVEAAFPVDCPPTGT